MGSAESLREFLGWCTIINVGLLSISAFIVMLMRGPISRLHGKMFGLSEETVMRAIYQYLAQYKIAVILLNLVPYLALIIMASP